MATVTHPTATVRARREPQHVRAGFPLRTIMELVTTRRELAPNPTPPQTAFAEVGHRAARITRPVNTLSIAEWQGVMGWPFQTDRKLTPLRIPIAPFQGQNPFAERVNVEMPQQTSLGAIASIKAPQYTAPQYVKLGVPA